jgi:hypothetical protein
MALIYASVQRQAALLSFVESFRIMGILFLISTVFVLLMKKPRARAAADGAPLKPVTPDGTGEGHSERQNGAKNRLLFPAQGEANPS